MKRSCFLLGLILILAACAPVTPPATPTPVPAAQPTRPSAAVPTPAPTREPTSAPAVEPTAGAGVALPVHQGAWFSTSGSCALCHTRLSDAAGNDVSIDSYWRSTMMANASRDPYWRATVRTEVLKNPAYQEVIEDKCATCHTPMARTTQAIDGESSALLDDGLFAVENPLHWLAIDGVSCTLCHQIEAGNLGQPESFSGHYEIDDETPAGERLNYGPFPVTEANAQLMKMSSGFEPVESLHIQAAQECAICHTLYTPFLDSNDEIAGEFPEQTPYLEWLYSDYRNQTACQECHMPAAEGGVVLSSTGGDPREPFRQHYFVGGNAFMIQILRDFGEEQAVTAAPKHFDATLARVTDQLQNRAATLTIENVVVDNQHLNLEVEITSLVGHKFPSGFPSRRVWLHLTVVDGQGETVFESGAVTEDGQIAGNDNDADASLYEPHYTLIEQTDQVQIYESVMHTTEDEVTTTLLRGVGYLKDNRLLPAGFVKGNHLPDVAVQGNAVGDADFIGGGDVTHYAVDLGDSSGPYQIHAELLYQTVGYRWAQNLAAYESAEVNQFLSYYDQVPNWPVTVAAAELTVE